MASDTTLSTLLAGLKAHAAAVAVAGVVVVGGGAAAAAAATGHLHLPGTSATDKHPPSAATQVAQCAGHNGDAANLAATYKSMFGGNATTAAKDICTLFVNTSGRHYGLGEVRLLLNIAAAIDRSGSSVCMNAVSAPASAGDSNSGDQGTSTASPGKSDADHGKPTATPGDSGDHGQTGFSVPSASASATMATIQGILAHVDQEMALAKLAGSCGAPLGPVSARPDFAAAHA